MKKKKMTYVLNLQMEETGIFSVLDYVLFVGLLCISAVIGVVSAFKGNRSPEEFLLGNRSLNPFVVSMSLLISFVSATNLVVDKTYQRRRYYIMLLEKMYSTLFIFDVAIKFK
ncbi:Sodium-coupled monocarboxylate transporter 1 [Armadillidium vulgare]|nr:Sodium-coupled monocarboxylate transporter 1 [Armadillidium vulgare]